MARDIRCATVVDADRTAVWRVISSSEGARDFFAPAAEVDLSEAGRYALGFEGPLTDGGAVLAWSYEQVIVIAWEIPKRLGGGTTRVRIALEPIDAEHTRVLVVHEFQDDALADRLAAHCAAAWELVLDRLRWRMALDSPAMDGYQPFWKGA